MIYTTKEQRCENPHPRIPGKTCGALLRLKFSDGDGDATCWRCGGLVYFDFRKVLTSVR